MENFALFLGIVSLVVVVHVCVETRLTFERFKI